MIMWSASSVGKHPHGRGEDKGAGSQRPTLRETPPRAWGRPHISNFMLFRLGNTPTGVGKTLAALEDWEAR